MLPLAADAAALGLLAGCSSSSTAASSGSTAAAEDKYTPGTYSASKTISYSEIGVSMTFDANSITACEITSSGEQDLLTDDKRLPWPRPSWRARAPMWTL